MRVGNGTVDIELRAGGWRASWLDARLALEAPTVSGRWETSPGEAFGRPGTWARCGDARNAPRVHVPAAGSVLTVGGWTEREGRLVPLDASVKLQPARAVRLVNGYQSWDHAGVRPGTEPGHTWWGGIVAEQPSGPALAFHAATAERLATSFRTRPEGDGVHLVVMSGAAPELAPVPGSWAFRAPEAGPLDPEVLGGVESEPVLVGADRSALTAMEDVGEVVGAASAARRWAGEPVVGWESWYHYGFSVTPEVVLENAGLMRERFGERFRVVQVDDGWERGYGDWRPRNGFPDDLSDLTAALRALGCTAGLWLAPFMVQPGGGGIGRERPDLLIRRGDEPRTDPLVGRHGVDASHPDAAEWLGALGATVREWGFDMVKLDFLYIGAMEGGRHDPEVTGTEALRRGLRAFVDGVGDDVYVLGCGMPLLPAVGICHGNRVGGDLAAPVLWQVPELLPFDPDLGWLGIHPQARNLAARWWTHRRLFDADPDVVMALGPDDGPPYTVEEVRTLATLAALCGGPFLLADALGGLPETKRAVLEAPWLADLAWGEGFRPVDLFGRVDRTPPEHTHYLAPPTDLASVWEATRDGRRYAALFNWGDRPATRSVHLGADRARELWTGVTASGPIVAVEVPPHGVRVFLVESAR